MGGGGGGGGGGREGEILLHAYGKFFKSEHQHEIKNFNDVILIPTTVLSKHVHFEVVFPHPQWKQSTCSLESRN